MEMNLCLLEIVAPYSSAGMVARRNNAGVVARRNSRDFRVQTALDVNASNRSIYLLVSDVCVIIRSPEHTD